MREIEDVTLSKGAKWRALLSGKIKDLLNSIGY
jgi:hypothetical protein